MAHKAGVVKSVGIIHNIVRVVHAPHTVCTVGMAHTAGVVTFVFYQTYSFFAGYSLSSNAYEPHYLGMLTVNERRYHHFRFACKPT